MIKTHLDKNLESLFLFDFHNYLFDKLKSDFC
jgi:hypothetical protein